MGRRAKLRKERRLAERGPAPPAAGDFLEDHDEQAGFIMDPTGWRRRGRDTVLYARHLKKTRALAERAFQQSAKAERAADPDARAAEELIQGALRQAVAPVGENAEE